MRNLILASLLIFAPLAFAIPSVCKIESYVLNSDGGEYVYYQLSTYEGDIQTVNAEWPALWSDMNPKAAISKARAEALSKVMNTAHQLKHAGACGVIINVIDQ